MKVTRLMRDSLLPLLAADEGQISVGPRRLTIRQLQAILDYQGYSAHCQLKTAAARLL